MFFFLLFSCIYISLKVVELVLIYKVAKSQNLLD